MVANRLLHYVAFQSFTLKVYPAELSLTALICFMGALEGAVATLVIEHNMSVWVIGWDSRLLAAAYSVSYHILKIETNNLV